jgi:hypothetical protein
MIEKRNKYIEEFYVPSLINSRTDVKSYYILLILLAILFLIGIFAHPILLRSFFKDLALFISMVSELVLSILIDTISIFSNFIEIILDFL